MQAYAVLMMFVYPFGLPLVFAILTRSRKYGWREQLDDDDIDELPGYMKRLIGPYRGGTEDKTGCYHFEVVECIRKLMLVGAPVFFDPQGSVAQLIFGLIICLFFTAIIAWLQPYKENNKLALLAQFTIFFTLLSSMALKYDAQALADSRNMGVLLCILTLMPIVLMLLEITLGNLLPNLLPTARVAIGPHHSRTA